jgi:VWFA-related protein
MLPSPFLFALLIVMDSFCWSSAAHQEPPKELIRVNANLVLVDVKVVNKETGRTVQGLKVEDFELYEDGIQQEITHLSQDKLPLSVLLVLDVSNSMQSVIKQLRQGALQALQHLKPEDEVALMAFASRPQLTQNFTKDRELIVNKIDIVTKRGYYAHTRDEGRDRKGLP